MVEAELKLFLDWSKYQHTEEHGNERRGGEQLVQHPEVDGLDLVLQLPVVIVHQPLEDRLLGLEIAVESERLTVPEVDESWEGFDAVPEHGGLSTKSTLFVKPFRQRWIFELDHLYAEHVTLVVNVLQLGDHLVTGPAVLFI